MPKQMVLDTEGAIRTLRAVVYEQGADYVYPGGEGSMCWNFVDGEPSCIVGKSLAMLGLTHEKAVDLNIAGSSDVESTCLALNMDDDFEWKITPQAVVILGVAQGVQDDRKTWGEALEAAEADVIRMVADAGRSDK